MRWLLILTLTLGTGGCATRGALPLPRQGLQPAIDSIIDAPPLHRTHWGVHVVDAASGRVLYTRNAERHFIPASNTKLVVGAVALARFGEDFRYQTELLATARAPEAADSAATLLAVGVGDPTWSARFHRDAAVPLDSMAAMIAAAGLNAVGELLVDASAFTDAKVHSAWEVGDLPWSYAPPVDAFGAGEGTFRLVVEAGPAPGDPAEARVLGPLPQPINVRATTDTAGARARLRVDYTIRRDTVHATGSVAAGAADTSTLALTRPAESTAHALAEALRRRGVRVAAVRVTRDTAEARAVRSRALPVFTYESAPMREIVAAILQPSQNWIAEHVLKTLGAVFGGEGSWSGGLAVEREYLYDVVGLDSGTVNLRDASGLSAQNLLTPAATVALLAHARAQPWGPAYRAALAGPGVTGTTLSGRLRALEGRVAAKTGTISNVNSLSGYLTTADGRDLIFSIYTNGSGLPAATVRSAIDALVTAVARHADGI